MWHIWWDAMNSHQGVSVRRVAGPWWVDAKFSFPPKSNSLQFSACRVFGLVSFYKHSWRTRKRQGKKHQLWKHVTNLNWTAWKKHEKVFMQCSWVPLRWQHLWWMASALRVCSRFVVCSHTRAGEGDGPFPGGLMSMVGGNRLPQAAMMSKRGTAQRQQGGEGTDQQGLGGMEGTSWGRKLSCSAYCCAESHGAGSEPGLTRRLRGWWQPCLQTSLLLRCLP